MQFDFSEQQRMIKDVAADFAAREVAPIAAEIDEKEQFPTDAVKKMGELGFMGMNVAEQYGGAALDTMCYVLALEDVCKACARRWASYVVR